VVEGDGGDDPFAVRIDDAMMEEGKTLGRGVLRSPNRTGGKVVGNLKALVMEVRV